MELRLPDADSARAEEEIQGLLQTYERALNASDASLAVSCYTKDGVFMPSGLPTSAGADLWEAYRTTFSRIRLQVRFAVDELIVASDRVAYGMTRSHGTQTMLSSGEESVESNRELFVFVQESGAWKIARYLFNKPM